MSRCWFGYFWLSLSPHPPSPWSAVCQFPHSLSREEFFPVIHPSCGRLHGQLKENCLARPKRGDHMLQHDLPSTLPLSPLGPHLWGFRGHGACGFFRNGVGRKTWRLQTNRTISPGSDWASPPEQPPTEVTKATSCVHNHRGRLSVSRFTPMLPLLSMLIIPCCVFVGEEWVEVETTGKPRNWWRRMALDVE